MSSKQNFSVSGNKKRAKYLAYRASINVADHKAPTPHPANSFLPPLVAGGEHYQPASSFGKTTEWLVSSFEGQGNTTPTLFLIDLMLGGTANSPTEQYRNTTPVDPTIPIVLKLTLPDKDTPGGKSIGNRINFGGNTGRYELFKYIVQPDPQIFNQSITVDPTVDQTGIAPEDFDNNKTILFGFEYLNPRLGDFLECRFGRTADITQVIGTWTITEANKNDPIVFTLTKDHAAPLEGECVVIVEGNTYPGVKATRSPVKKVYVFKQNRPANFDPLHLPQIIDPGDKLEIQEFIDGITAGLEKPYTNHSRTLDKLAISIDGVRQPSLPINAFPFQNLLNSAALLALGDDREVELEYQIERLGFFFPPVPVARKVKVDVRMPLAPIVPPNYSPPDVTALAPTLKGPVSPPNILTMADKQNGGDVVLNVTVHTEFNLGDTLYGYFGGHPIPAPGGVYPYPATGNPPNPIPLPMSWAFVNSIGTNKDMQLQYVVEHTKNNNQSVSMLQLANVNLTPVVLQAATFVHEDSNFGIICDSLRKVGGDVGAVINIPGDSQLANLMVKCKYVGYSAQTATDPDIIDDSIYEHEFKFDPTDVGSGAFVFIPYQYLLATRNAWGVCSFEVVIAGERVSTKSKVYRVNMSYGGDTCDISGPPPFP